MVDLPFIITASLLHFLYVLLAAKNVRILKIIIIINR